MVQETGIIEEDIWCIGVGFVFTSGRRSRQFRMI